MSKFSKLDNIVTYRNMITKIVVDGNDGTGKTSTINGLKKLFPGITVEDRGIFSEATLIDEIFEEYENRDDEVIYRKPRTWLHERHSEINQHIFSFLSRVSASKDTLFIICKADPEVCQKRIKERGDSIEEQYHTMEDLKKYGERFDILVDIAKHHNVMVIDTTHRENPDS